MKKLGFVSGFIVAGVSLPEIMERLGHKDDATTRHVYPHITKSMKKEASRKVHKELLKRPLFYIKRLSC